MQPQDDDSPIQAAASLIEHRSALMELLSVLATSHSAADELRRSVRALAGASWELAKFNPPPVEQLNVFFPSNNLLYSYILFAVIPSMYSQEILVRPSTRTGDVVEALHDELLKCLPPQLTDRIKLTRVSQRSFVRSSSSANLVVFTGQYLNGLHIVEQLRNSQRVLLFGSGPNPVIVGQSCDIKKACVSLLSARLYNSGQDCLGPDVIFVHSAILESVVDTLSKSLANAPRGERHHPATVVSPLVYADAVDHADVFLEKYSRYTVLGGSVDRDIGWVEPSLLVLEKHSDFHPDELFSPIVVIVPYSDPQFLYDWAAHPVELTRGMYCSVFGEPFLERQRFGTAVILRNMSALDAEDGNQPFGGFGVQASSVHHAGQHMAMPLLLSEQAASLDQPISEFPQNRE